MNQQERKRAPGGAESRKQETETGDREEGRLPCISYGLNSGFMDV